MMKKKTTEYVPLGFKMCSRCCKIKSISEFYTNSKGRVNPCKECVKDVRKIKLMVKKEESRSNFERMVPVSPFFGRILSYEAGSSKSHIKVAPKKKVAVKKTKSVLAKPGKYDHDVQYNPDLGTLSWKVPIRLESPNKQLHWRTKDRKNKEINKSILYTLPREWKNVNLPCTITLIRIAPRGLDSDNLAFAFKGIRDFMADLFVPGLAPGRADGDSRLEWEYDQNKGIPGEYAIRISIIYKVSGT